MEGAPRALEAKATERHRVWVRFEDGLQAEIDFDEMVQRPGYYTDPLKDPEFFRQVDVYPGGHGLFWSNECDVCPDRLYELAQAAAGLVAPTR